MCTSVRPQAPRWAWPWEACCELTSTHALEIDQGVRQQGKKGDVRRQAMARGTDWEGRKAAQMACSNKPSQERDAPSASHRQFSMSGPINIQPNCAYNTAVRLPAGGRLRMRDAQSTTW